MPLLEQNITTKRRADENITEFEAGSNKKGYKIEEIWDSTVCAKELAAGHLLNLYYLIP